MKPLKYDSIAYKAKFTPGVVREIRTLLKTRDEKIKELLDKQTKILKELNGVRKRNNVVTLAKKYKVNKSTISRIKYR